MRRYALITALMILGSILAGREERSAAQSADAQAPSVSGTIPPRRLAGQYRKATPLPAVSNSQVPEAPPPPPRVRRVPPATPVVPLMPVPDDGLLPRPPAEASASTPPTSEEKSARSSPPSKSTVLPTWGPPAGSRPMDGGGWKNRTGTTAAPADPTRIPSTKETIAVEKGTKPAPTSNIQLSVWQTDAPPMPLGNRPEGTQPAKETLTTGERPPMPLPSAPEPGTPSSAVLLEKIGPAALNVGLPLAYEIVARNISNVPLFNVRLDEELPAGCRFLRSTPEPTEARDNRLSWVLGTLEAGGERRFQIEIQPGGEGEARSSATLTSSASGCLQTRITQPHMAVAVTGPESVQVGDAATFQIQVTNVGTGPAAGVVLHSQLPPGLRHDKGERIEAPIDVLAAGESKPITLSTTAALAGKHALEVQVTAENATPDKTEAGVIVTEPALVLRQNGPQTRFLDREAEFDIEVSNPGTAPATNVRVIDNLPPGLECTGVSDGGIHNPQSHTVVWNLGTLQPGQRRGLMVKLLGKTPGDFVNQAVALADRGLEVKAESHLRVEGIPALMLEVVDLDDPIEAGAETTYEIRVLNQGSCASTGLRIIAAVPPGMEPRGGDGPTASHIQGQNLVFEPLEKLAPRADALYRIRVFCREPGDRRFKVQMSCDQLQMPVHEEESTSVYRE